MNKLVIEEYLPERGKNMMYQRVLPSMIYGLAAILIFSLGFSLIISLILSFSSLTESSFALLIVISSFITLFIGGFISGLKSKEKGLLVGTGTALLFTLITFLIQYLGYNQGLSMEQLMFHGGYLLTAALGGVIGVNLFSRL